MEGNRHLRGYDMAVPPPGVYVDLSVPPPEKTEDELFIDAWLSKIGKTASSPTQITRNPVPSPRQTPLNATPVPEMPCKPAIPDTNGKSTNASKTKKKPPSISSTKEALRQCLLIIDRLELTQGELQQNLATMPSEEWKKRTVEIGSLRDKLSNIMSQFNNPDTLTMLKRTIQKRARKRVNQQKRRLLSKAAREEKRLETLKEHERIDRWLESKRDGVERAKAEESMKKDADCVLSEVTKKKSDARKQLALISALTKLRDVRETAWANSGKKLSTENRLAFQKTAVKLTEMWDKTLGVYGKEEQGLKIMLEETKATEVKALSSNKEKQIVQQWETVLFGENYVPETPVYWGLTSAERDLETFVAIRRSWDTFLTGGDEGSKIPVGWVVPSEDAGEAWKEFIK